MVLPRNSNWCLQNTLFSLVIVAIIKDLNPRTNQIRAAGRRTFFSAVTRKEKNSLETKTKTMNLNDLQRLVISCHSCHVMSPNPIRILI